MRVDKFLKVSRLIKRRSVAKDITEQDRIYINEKLAKPSSQVKPGDTLKIVFGNKIVVVKINNVNEHASKEESSLMYQLIQEEKQE